MSKVTPQNSMLIIEQNGTAWTDWVCWTKC